MHMQPQDHILALLQGLLVPSDINRITLFVIHLVIQPIKQQFVNGLL